VKKTINTIRAGRRSRLLNCILNCLRGGFLGMGLIALSGCHSAPAVESAKAETVIPVQVVTVRTAMATATEQYTAEIKADRQVELSYRVSGQVSTLYEIGGRRVQPGDFVPRGTVLARLRETEFQAQVSKARAQIQENEAAQANAQATLAKAGAALEQARINEERAQRLYRADGVTQPEFDQARTQLEIAKAEMKTAQAALSLAQAQAGAARAQLVEGETTARDTALEAPFAGVVLQRNLEQGATVVPGAGNPQFVLADIQRVKAVFQVPDITLRRLRIGRQVTVQTAAIQGSEMKGQVSSIAPNADPTTRLFAVEVTLSNRQSLLRPGMVAAVNLADETPREVVAVPPSAIGRATDDPQAYRVFVIDDRDGKTYARLRRVTLGQASGENIVITGGLSVGERAIVGGNNTVRADAEVRIVP
jgi:RND family efflux transporter MFP subunit